MKLKKIILAAVVLIGAFLLYATVLRKSEILTKAEVKAKYATPVSKFIDWNGCEIHYTDDGAGFPVVMIHGLGGSCYDFAVLDSLMLDSYRIIRVDLPGFGLSDFPATHDKDSDFSKLYGQFFNFFIDTLHLDSFYVMGNSMGGMMAWDLAVEHPEKVRKLVLLSSAGYDMEKVSEHVTQVFRYKWIQALLHKGIPKFATKIGVRSCFYDKNFFTEQKLQRVNDFWNIKGNLQVIFDLSNTHKFLDTSLIAKIACPTLILWGRQDNLISYNYADRFHRDIKNSSEIIYDSCGHIPMGEHPLDVERDVRKFFSEK